MYEDEGMWADGALAVAGEGGDGWAPETGGTPRRPLVTSFSGPAAECTAALRRAGKTRAEALDIISWQVGAAIAMLRVAAARLERGRRSQDTRDLFRKIFRVTPEFVPTWLTPTAQVRDRGDVVRVRCLRVADLLASRTISWFCTISTANCPDCGNDPDNYACSSWGTEGKAPKRSRVICLGNGFWDDMKKGDSESMLSTLVHEPFHIYFGKYVTAHRDNPGKFGGINCIVRFVFEASDRAAPARVKERCDETAVRKEMDELETEPAKKRAPLGGVRLGDRLLAMCVARMRHGEQSREFVNAVGAMRYAFESRRQRLPSGPVADYVDTSEDTAGFIAAICLAKCGRPCPVPARFTRYWAVVNDLHARFKQYCWACTPSAPGELEAASDEVDGDAEWLEAVDHGLDAMAGSAAGAARAAGGGCGCGGRCGGGRRNA